jgi:xylulokinase
VLWVMRHRPDQFHAARWVVSPRDAVIAWLTGAIGTDVTLASRTGWFALSGGPTAEAEARLGERLPPVLASTDVVGALLPEVAEDLGLCADTPVVIGAGDRQCESLGVGATATVAMVSWGTTTNVSVPHPGPIDTLPAEAAVSRSAQADPFLLEAGLSASGAALAWLATLTARSHDELLDLAAVVEPGSRGVVALPWLHGARGPWWKPDAHAAFLGLSAAHGPAELARATIEAVGFDVARCIDLLGIDADVLALAGGGAVNELWRTVLAATTNRPWVRRRHDDAASVGARLLVATALGEPLELDAINPVVASGDPDPGIVAAYRSVRTASDTAAEAVLRAGDRLDR